LQEIACSLFSKKGTKTHKDLRQLLVIGVSEVRKIFKTKNTDLSCTTLTFSSGPMWPTWLKLLGF